MAEAPQTFKPPVLHDSDVTHDITIELANLSISPATPLISELQTQQATLYLLQPLANADILAGCRTSRSSDNLEVLNIQSLSKAWRQAMLKENHISQVTFDISLPKREENNSGFQKVYWDVSVPREGGFALNMREIMTLAFTIATELRMRVKGDIRFKVNYDETDGIRLGQVKLLKKQLLGIAEFKGSVRRVA